VWLATTRPGARRPEIEAHMLTLAINNDGLILKDALCTRYFFVEGVSDVPLDYDYPEIQPHETVFDIANRIMDKWQKRGKND
jgi:hypothetical protein